MISEAEIQKFSGECLLWKLSKNFKKHMGWSFTFNHFFRECEHLLRSLKAKTFKFTLKYLKCLFILRSSYLYNYLRRNVTFSNFTNGNTPPWVFFTIFKLYKRYQIVQSVSFVHGEGSTVGVSDYVITT